MKLKKILFLVISIFYLLGSANAIDIELSENELLEISPFLLIYEDTSSLLSIEDITKKTFSQYHQSVPNLGISNSMFWIKIPFKNLTNKSKFLLELSSPTIDNVDYYFPDSLNKYSSIKMGEELSFKNRKYLDPNYLFDVTIQKNETKTFYLKVSSKESILLPIKIGSHNAILNQTKNRDILSGLYFGIMLVMIFYNLFVYFSVKDQSYIYYVIYILLVLLTQTSLQGYTFQYLWPNHPIIAQYSIFIFPGLVGIAGMVFMNVFLKVNFYNKKLFKLSIFLSGLYLVTFILAFLQVFSVSQQLLQVTAMLVSLHMLFTSIYIVRKGYQPAKYFLIAWVIFLLGVIVFILKDVGVLPFNNLTRYTMQIGSAIETVLLSFALAARINDYKREKEISQKQAFDALEKNELLVREQNVVLEQKVEERTVELNKTLANLREAQSQLVDAEKMSALGQLTAGVAHEINNPINFVSSNISPLKQDIDDLKSIIEKYEEIDSTSDISEKLEEIEQLKQELDYEFLKTELQTIIKGIENGANRTTEIVKSLRNFSRLDESDLMLADVNEGITSTLAILKSAASNIDVVKNLNPLPQISCYPGKLNQVFLNIINNAIQATKENLTRKEQGKIEIESIEEENNIKITISDNGIGIPDDVKEKIFDPFFTTKKVGDGTGLGLSIAYRIIENHNGQINVDSILNKGTTFTIIIPKL